MSVMRSALLMASENAWLRERAPRYRFIRRTVERFLPGENLDDAVAAAQRLAGDGIDTLFTHLGENVVDRGEAEAVTAHYLGAIDRIRAAQLPTEISVKLTQLGLDLDREFCYANLLKLIERQRAESTPRESGLDRHGAEPLRGRHSRSLRARETSLRQCGSVRAGLFVSHGKGSRSLIAMGAAVRLVKGAYNEPSEIAYPKKSDVDENYFHLAQRLLSPEARRAGVRPACHARREVNRADRRVGRGAGNRKDPDGIRHALRHPARRAVAIGSRRLSLRRARILWLVLVSLVHAPVGGAPRQRAFSRAQLLWRIGREKRKELQSCGSATLRVRSSFSILPSRRRITRWACSAISGSCVTRMMVLPLLVQAVEERHDFLTGLRVEVAGGLVGQHDRRIVDQSARNCDALPLTAGKLVGLVGHARFHAHRPQDFLGPFDALLRRHTGVN